jgi:hypothetical protein
LIKANFTTNFISLDGPKPRGVMTGPIWQPSELLAATLLETYRDMFKAALAEGTRRNFILPYDFIPSFFLPILVSSPLHLWSHLDTSSSHVLLEEQ